MSRRLGRGLSCICWVLCGLSFLILFVLPLITSLLLRNRNTIPEGATDYLIWIENLLSYGMLAFAAAWIVFLGGTFASFLNVVAWRVPRGKSILGSSHCPYCDVRLKFRDNVPFVGWIKNGGRCSVCRLPISARYLVVEITLGMIFLMVSAAMMLSGGFTLPIREQDVMLSINRMVLEPQNDLVAILVFHLVAILSLFVFSLIELERFKIPLSVFAVSLIFLVAIPIVWPTALMVSWKFPFTTTHWPFERSEILSTIMIGIISGLAIGAFLDRFLYPHDSTMRLPFGMAVVGVFAGWQSTVIVGEIFAVIAVIGGSLSTSRNTDEEPKNLVANLYWSPHVKLLAATVVHLATWRWLNLLG